MKNGISTIEDLMLLIFFIALIVIAFALVYVIFQINNTTKRLIAEKTGAVYEEPDFKSWWKKLKGTTVDIEDEDAIMMDHNYDGIRELNNHLPPWWTGLFYVTIIFAVFYLLIYQVWKTAPNQIEEFNIAMADADKSIKAYLEKQGNTIDENTVTLNLEDSDAIANGKLIYDTNCMACHGIAGEGTVGPNLTDEYWVHGGSVHDVFRTIKYGVPEKGMISWESLLKPAEIQDVSNFILSLQGTNPANPKDPEGEKYIPEASESTSEGSSSEEE